MTNGNNTFTAIATNSLGQKDTNVVSVTLLTNVNISYDARGNLTGDGRRGLTYDDENRLTRVTVTNQWKMEFGYDGLGRRVLRSDYEWTSAGWSQTNGVRYVHDGLLVIQERDNNNAPLVTYTRGQDLSGGLDEAGGIGGLLARTDSVLFTNQSPAAHAYYHADGNGNITALINSNQLVAARYWYDPYGNSLGAVGPLAEANTMRFSSKQFNPLSGLYHYGFRDYDPNLQRWITPDPIGEEGGSTCMGLFSMIRWTRLILTGCASIQ